MLLKICTRKTSQEKCYIWKQISLVFYMNYSYKYKVGYKNATLENYTLSISQSSKFKFVCYISSYSVTLSIFILACRSAYKIQDRRFQKKTPPFFFLVRQVFSQFNTKNSQKDNHKIRQKIAKKRYNQKHAMLGSIIELRKQIRGCGSLFAFYPASTNNIFRSTSSSLKKDQMHLSMDTG